MGEVRRSRLEKQAGYQQRFRGVIGMLELALSEYTARTLNQHNSYVSRA